MKEVLMAKGARKLVDVCAGVKPGENVLIITDFTKTELALPVAAAANQAKAEVVMATMLPRSGHGQEPPATIAQAMLKADVIMALVSNSITHTRSMKAALEAGARGLVMTDWVEKMMYTGGIEADFYEAKKVCTKIADAFAAASQVRLTSPGGTDLTMAAAGRPGNAMYCLVEPGMLSPVPNVEANFSPIEGSAQGRIVCDGSLPYIDIGVIEENIVCEVKDGMITKIQGGAQARMLIDDLEKRNDPQVYNVAELGVGLNPHSHFQGLMLEDEGVFGSVHIGIGTNVTLGGHVKAAIHYDLIMRNPTLELDGKVILKDGDVVI